MTSSFRKATGNPQEVTILSPSRPNGYLRYISDTAGTEQERSRQGRDYVSVSCWTLLARPA
jgi:hypothetical protein